MSFPPADVIFKAFTESVEITVLDDILTFLFTVSIVNKGVPAKVFTSSGESNILGDNVIPTPSELVKDQGVCPFKVTVPSKVASPLTKIDLSTPIPPLKINPPVVLLVVSCVFVMYSVPPIETEPSLAFNLNWFILLPVCKTKSRTAPEPVAVDWIMCDV